MDFVFLRDYLNERAVKLKDTIQGLKRDLKRDNFQGNLRDYYEDMVEDFSEELAKVELLLSQVRGVIDGATY